MTPHRTWHDSSSRVTQHIFMCDMTLFYVWHDSWSRDLAACDMTHNDSSSHVTWLFIACDMTHFYVWNDSVPRGTWLISMCDMTRSHVGLGSFIRVAWLAWFFPTYHFTVLTPICGMSHFYMWHDSFPCAIGLIPMCDMILSHIFLDCTHSSF